MGAVIKIQKDNAHIIKIYKNLCSDKISLKYTLLFNLHH